MIRVLVVDDSATARELIVAILSSAPDIQVVGQAENGAEGVALTGQLRPDVITMDINMPIMDGYEATTTIMSEQPTPIVVVTSVSSEEMIHHGLDILLAGALEIVQKPSATTTHGYATISQELVDKVRAVSQIELSPAGAQS